MGIATRFLNFALAPQKALLKACEKVGTGSFSFRLQYDLFERPHYAYCLYGAARLAHRLGQKRICAVEFGVAGGAGLLALEKLAWEIEKEFPVEIELYGFDTGEGLPEPVDYRDLPYIWKAGFYKMDQPALRNKLRKAELIIGDVKDTVPTFFERRNPAMLGAAFLDLDFWSSTVAAMQIFDGPVSRMLPRVFCYYDDVMSADAGGILSEDVGQLLAIREYNETRAKRKMRTIAGFSHTRSVRAKWNDQIYVHHAFDHPQYNEYVHREANRQLSI